MDKWYVLHTRPRWEKKVADTLEQKGIETYCPVKKVKRKWSDRIKIVEEPFFKACVFVKISLDQRTEVRLTEGVMNFVYRNGKPAQVKESEMRMFKKKLDLAVVFDDVSGEVTEKRNKPLQVYLDSFHQWLMAYTERPKLV